jgi:hypothetical protein
MAYRLTYEQPSGPGWYWLECFGDLEIIEIVKTKRCLEVRSMSDQEQGGSPIKDYSNNCRWSERIEESEL